jgi:hypothetical protein
MSATSSSQPSQQPSQTVANKFAKVPNFGSNSVVRTTAMDDATKAFLVPISSLRKCPMGFLHVKFMVEVLKTFVPNYPELTELIKICEISLDLTRLRQFDLVQEVNFVITSKNNPNLILHTVTDKALQFVQTREAIIDNARLNGFDVERYLTINNDDITQSTNDWNMENQNKEAGSASDYVLIIRDIDDEWYVAVIERAYGPSRGDAAFPGGFVDKKNGFIESFEQCAKRELSEETEIDITTEVNKSVYTGQLSVVTSPSEEDGQEFVSWDVRAKFVKGMINGGTYEVRVYSV